MVEGSNLPVIEAREILERIERGEPVIYEHAAIAGDIDLSRLDLPFIETSGRRGKPYAFQDYFRNAIQTYIFS